ncbi:hypothetical protein KOW79_016960 [Hemibagrus wyckioides]|uniref:Isopenicillin N synthase-like Fe(2+) 2OG dioxygenase domain-containing protein n=1 Tax=Hemibagrus wyckioides TaxID=337641 RepID=A0A9D3NFC1_9TELE|nr:hypothetical protein KOW79_016960 [Hemibagrus wyckioides]
MDISKKFFLLPEEQKKPFSRGSYANNGNHGWVSSETESLNPRRPGDLKEAFNTTSLHPDIKWPSDGCDGFRDIKVDFFLRSPVKTESVKIDQIRCGEHSDYGSISLVLQSQQEGLQVLNRKGEFISAPSIPGTVLINIADMMQRVLLPPVGDSSARQSLVFFVQPDDDAIITCCDGSNKYPPVKSLDYLLSRFNDTYGRK